MMEGYIIGVDLAKGNDLAIYPSSIEVQRRIDTLSKKYAPIMGMSEEHLADGLRSMISHWEVREGKKLDFGQSVFDVLKRSSKTF